MGRAAIRSRFIRLVVESLQAQLGSVVVTELKAKLPPRLCETLASVLRDSRADATVPLEQGQALLLAIDGATGERPGRALERAGRSIADQILSTDPKTFEGKSASEVFHSFRGPLLNPFVDVLIGFSLSTADGSVLLSLNVPTLPSTSRVLRHLAIGFARAAFARDARVQDITSETIGDRALVRVTYEAASPGASSTKIAARDETLPKHTLERMRTIRAPAPEVTTTEHAPKSESVPTKQASSVRPSVRPPPMSVTRSKASSDAPRRFKKVLGIDVPDREEE